MEKIGSKQKSKELETKKEAAILEFCLALRTAHSKHIVLYGTFTNNMAIAWYKYVNVMEEIYNINE